MPDAQPGVAAELTQAPDGYRSYLETREPAPASESPSPGEGTDASAVPAAEPPSPAATDTEQRIPYDRFREVNDELRDYKAKVAAYEAKASYTEIGERMEKLGAPASVLSAALRYAQGEATADDYAVLQTPQGQQVIASLSGQTPASAPSNPYDPYGSPATPRAPQLVQPAVPVEVRKQLDDLTKWKQQQEREREDAALETAIRAEALKAGIDPSKQPTRYTQFRAAVDYIARTVPENTPNETVRAKALEVLRNYDAELLAGKAAAANQPPTGPIEGPAGTAAPERITSLDQLFDGWRRELANPNAATA